jgi:hypothetical protein
VSIFELTDFSTHHEVISLFPAEYKKEKTEGSDDFITVGE